MANPSKQKSEPQPTLSEQVTYIPGPDGPTEVTWKRRTFRANVPVTVADQEMIELAKGNKFFRVGAFDAGGGTAAPTDPPSPKTSDQYKAWAVHWFKQMKSAAELKARWDSEEELRKECGVGSDDIAWLDTLYNPLYAELEKRDKG